MSKRKPIGKKLRFEVFKRDSFTCQYCGRSAPDVLLHVDHIKPVVDGGTNDITNLITSCQDCNLGKGGRKLSDKTAVMKAKKQLDDLNERREQMKMMVEWKEELSRMKEEQTNIVCEYFHDKIFNQFRLSNRGRIDIDSLIKKYGIDEVMTAIDIAVSNYAKFDKGGNALTKESVETMLGKLGGILYNRKTNSYNEDMKEIFYIVGILKNRLCYHDRNIAIKLLKEAVSLDVKTSELRQMALEARNWTQWRSEMNYLIRGE